jgi:hypothetical protein
MYEETQKIVERSIREKKIESRAIRSHDTKTMLGPSRKGTTGNVREIHEPLRNHDLESVEG